MNWRAVYALLVRNIKRGFRHKDELFWMIIFPIMMMFLVAYVFIPPERTIMTIDLGIVNYDGNPAGFNFTAQDFMNVLKNVTIDDKKLFKVKVFNSTEEGLRALKKGDLDALLVIPSGFTVNLTYSKAHLKVYILSADPMTKQVAEAELMGFLQGFASRTSKIKFQIMVKYMMKYVPEEYRDYIDIFIKYMEGIVEPVNVTYETVYPERMYERGHIIGWLAIGMIGIMIMYSGFYSGSLALISEREGGTLRRLFAAPITYLEIYITVVLDVLISTAITAAIVLTMSIFLLGAKFTWISGLDFAVIVALYILAALFTVSIGILISLVSKSVRGAAAIANGLAFPLMFLTGIWIPKFMLPPALHVIADYFPLTKIIDGIRDLVIYGKSITEVMTYLPIPVVVTLVLTAIGVLIFRRSVEKMLVG